MSWTTNIGLWTCACLLLAETASALDFDESQRIYEETYVGEQSTPLTPEVDTTMVGGLIVSDFDNASLTGDALHIFIPNPAPPAPLESNLGLAHSPTPTTSTIGSASIGVRARFANVLIAGTGDGGSKHHRGMASANLNLGPGEQEGWCLPHPSNILELWNQQSPTRKGGSCR